MPGMVHEKNISKAVETDQYVQFQKFERFFQDATLGIFQTTTEGCILRVNPALSTMFGYDSPQHLLFEIGDSAQALYADPVYRTEFLGQLKQAKSSCMQEIVFQRRDRSIFYGKITAWSVTDQQGHPRLLEGFIEDMTPFVEARAVLERKSAFQKTLSTVASRFINSSDFKEELRLGMSDVGQVSGVSRVSVFFFRSEAQTINQMHEWCAPGIPSQQGMFQDLRIEDFPWLKSRLLQGEEIQVLEVDSLPGDANAEQAILRKKGIISCLIYPLYIDQRLMGCVGFEDIRRTGAWQSEYQDLLSLFTQMVGNACARKEMQETMRQGEKLEAIGTLAGGIAHDFNNILAAVGNLALLALEDLPAESQAAKDLEQILRASDRGKELVGQILSFSRKDGARKKRLTFSSSVQEAVDLLHASLPSSINLDLDIRDSVSQVEADPVDIQKLIINLCTNARDALEQNEGRIEIKLEQRNIQTDECPVHHSLKPGPYVFLRVSDTGSGIPEAIHSKIFDPFYTTKAKGKGTGLGLAQVKRILEVNGADFVIKTALGEGTTFEVYWPCLPSASPAGPQHNTEEYPQGRGMILLAEDQKDVKDTTARFLQQQGYTVLAEANGRQAFHRFKSSPEDIDLLLTDLIMPEMNGKDLAIQLLKIKPDLPIIVCSGYNDQTSDHDLRSYGIQHVLAKPVDWRRLSKLIESLI